MPGGRRLDIYSGWDWADAEADLTDVTRAGNRTATYDYESVCLIPHRFCLHFRCQDLFDFGL
jgi:hypothetical protein